MFFLYEVARERMNCYDNLTLDIPIFKPSVYCMKGPRLYKTKLRLGGLIESIMMGSEAADTVGFATMAVGKKLFLTS